MQGHKAMLSFIYGDELETGVSHNWGVPFWESPWESRERNYKETQYIQKDNYNQVLSMAIKGKRQQPQMQWRD